MTYTANGITSDISQDEKPYSFTIPAANLHEILISVVFTAIPVTGIMVIPDTVSMLPGEELMLQAVVAPEGALQTVTWTSSDANVATVDLNTGKVTAVATGECVITATTVAKNANSAELTATCTVVVEGEHNVSVASAA